MTEPWSKRYKKLLALVTLFVVISSLIWIPALVFAVTDTGDKFAYYIAALERMLLVHAETLGKIIDLFSEAVYGS